MSKAIKSTSIVSVPVWFHFSEEVEYCFTTQEVYDSQRIPASKLAALINWTKEVFSDSDYHIEYADGYSDFNVSSDGTMYLYKDGKFGYCNISDNEEALNQEYISETSMGCIPNACGDDYVNGCWGEGSEMIASINVHSMIHSWNDCSEQ